MFKEGGVLMELYKQYEFCEIPVGAIFINSLPTMGPAEVNIKEEETYDADHYRIVNSREYHRSDVKHGFSSCARVIFLGMEKKSDGDVIWELSAKRGPVSLDELESTAEIAKKDGWITK